ncbi:hypothetical protein SISSUDRAFT_836069 [Sistotremastrum suecicum HHB10207 ss-3]|uniref:F-box domain-containing protein n=1 Tax=Sistotremastrum suecicum HHB10207 ss-3 TaxID=1314776 RepID=A0A166CKG6_9AGAM|nr:hypothetical protein SISSUDRAFT_836069 [Sistotremastrum suecicum HHB10207 ss-3]
MSNKIPAEIFHRIIWDFLLSPETNQGPLLGYYHLQQDRQVCVYSLVDFKNTRLVCRLWNKWLLNDFDCWRHLCIRGSKSLLIAIDTISRFPEHPFQIRIRVEADPDADSEFGDGIDFPFLDPMDDESDEDPGLIGFGSEDSLSNVDEEEPSGEGDGGITDNAHGVAWRDLPLDEGASDLDDDFIDGDDEDAEKEYDFFPPPPKSEVDLFWVQEAIDLVTPLIPHCHGLFLHLPTSMIHIALVKWENGAPNLRRCAFEAIDYDGRTSKDLRRYMFSADRRKLKPPPPPLRPFLSKSLDLESVLIMNYYVPTRSHRDLGFDITRLREFAMVYDRHDAPIIGPMKDDVMRSLIRPASENRCHTLILDLAIVDFGVPAYYLHLNPTLENLTLSHAQFRISYPVPTHSPPTNCHIKRFTLAEGPLIVGRHRGIPKEAHALQHLFEEMPELESLSLIQVNIICPIWIQVTDPDADVGPYEPPSIPLPQLTTLFLEDSAVSSKSVIALLKRTPNLENLTLTSKNSINIKPIIQALRTISRGSPTVPCPQLRWLRILHSTSDLERDSMPYYKMVAEVEILETKRDAWLAKGRCVPFWVERISLEEFRKKYYGCSVI